MDEQKWEELIGMLMVPLQIIEELKKMPEAADPRALSIAATHIETGMLWLANARRDV